MSESKLSDRLKESSLDLIEQYMKHPLVSQFLMNGSLANAEAVCKQKYKDSVDLFPFMTDLLEIASQKSDDPKDKVMFEEFVKGFLDSFENWMKSYNKKFGSVSIEKTWEEMASKTQIMSEYLNLVKNQTVLEIIITVMGPIYLHAVINEYIRSNPNYEPNPYFDVFSYSILGLEEAVKLFMPFIDEKGKDVTEEKTIQLCEIWKQSIASKMQITDEELKA